MANELYDASLLLIIVFFALKPRLTYEWFKLRLLLVLYSYYEVIVNSINKYTIQIFPLAFSVWFVTLKCDDTFACKTCAPCFSEGLSYSGVIFDFECHFLWREYLLHLPKIRESLVCFQGYSLEDFVRKNIIG